MFIEAANKNNIAQAAPMFDTTKDRIRNHIIHLEQEIGTALFIKTPTGSYLNKEGEIMYKAFMNIMLEYQNALSLIHSSIQREGKRYSLGVTSKLYNSHYHSILNSDEVLKQYSFDCHVLNYDKFYDAIIKEKIDFAFLYDSKEVVENKSLVHIPIYTDQLCLLISEKLDISKLKELSIKDIKNLTIYYEAEDIAPKINLYMSKLSKNNNLIKLEEGNYDYPYNRINEEGACLLWHLKDSEKKFKAGLIAVPIVGTIEKYSIVFKDTDEKRRIADEIVEEYRNTF